MEIHQASIDDLEALVAMLEILFSQEAEFWPDPDAQRRGLALILESTSTGVIWVMRDETGIHGMLVMLFSVSTALGGRVGVLEDFVVLPASRHRGLGRQLLAHAARTAKEMGLCRLTLLCDSDNADAMKLYRQSGWVRSPMVPMRLKCSTCGSRSQTQHTAA